jgi:hypothetical protein
MSSPADQDLLEIPVYTKDEDYVGVVEDIDNENGKVVIRDRNEMRTYSVP